MTEQRFMSKIKKTDTCWYWTAAKTKAGYGMYSIKHKLIYAHRYSYQMFVGELVANMELDHTCRNRDCVNPNHLEQVSHKENIMRGEAWNKFIRHNSLKTKCPKGHNYDYIYNGKRGCKKCRNIQAKKHMKGKGV
jgi:hypothetical protein